MPDAYAKFDDQQLGYAFSYTLSLGSQPGTARVSAPIDAGRVAPVGALDVFWQGRRFFRLHDARLVNPSSPGSTTAAPAIEWTIEDRRWKWQYGSHLDGDYNVPQKDGTLLREKSPRDLAKLIFEALGEKEVNVDALPREPRPRMIWHAADPRQELDRLCGLFACAPAYDPFANRVYVVKLGKGTAPSGLAHKSRTNATTSRPQPDAIRFLGGPTLFQSAIDLGDPLALEVDGTYVDRDGVSYKPAAGWAAVNPFTFAGLNTTYTDAATGETLYHRDLAVRSIHRVFRIKGQAAGGFSPAALKGKDNEPKSILDLGPFTGTVLERDPLTGERMPAYARGVFADKRHGMGNSPDKTRWPGSVTINSDLRIVIFDQPVVKFDSALQLQTADLELIAAYEVSHEGVPVRYEKKRDLPGKGYSAGEHREYREEVVREIVEKTASSTGKKVDNLKEIDKQAKYYIDEVASQFRDRPAASVVYPGLEKFSPDGVLRTVSWSFSTSSSPQTSVGWDTDVNKSVRPWEDRQEARVQKQLDAALRQKAATEARKASRANAIAGK